MLEDEVVKLVVPSLHQFTKYAIRNSVRVSLGVDVLLCVVLNARLRRSI